MMVTAHANSGGEVWIIARRFSDFAALRAALRAIPGSKISIRAPFPSKFSGSNALRKNKAAADATQKRDRCLLLDAWMNEVISKHGGPNGHARVNVSSFCAKDGSDTAIADISIVRRRLVADGRSSTDTHSASIKGCKLEKLLGAEGKGRIGERSALEKSQYLLSTSRLVEGMPSLKKHYILSVLTPPDGLQKAGDPRSGLVSAKWVEWLHRHFVKGVQHPFVANLHDVVFATFQASKAEPVSGKVIVLRDFVNLGSLRDKVCGVKIPLLGFNEKYSENGTPLPPKPKKNNPLHLMLIAKQVAIGMRYLEQIGLSLDFVHCGNVLLLADGRGAGGKRAPAVAISDVENALLRMPAVHPGPVSGAFLPSCTQLPVLTEFCLCHARSC
jgi:hypothetical protein